MTKFCCFWFVSVLLRQLKVLQKAQFGLRASLLISPIRFLPAHVKISMKRKPPMCVCHVCHLSCLQFFCPETKEKTKKEKVYHVWRLASSPTGSFFQHKCVCVSVCVLCIFCCTLLSTEMFGGLLRPMSFCLAALLWTCTAQKMLSNRAAGAAQTQLKTGQASRNSRRP